MKLTSRLFQALISIDQTFNTLIGSGWADETLSAFSHRRQGWRRSVVNAIFFWQTDHCRDAFNAELERRQYRPEYRPPTINTK